MNVECHSLFAKLHQKTQTERMKKLLSTITLGYVQSRKGSQNAKDFKRLRILLDSGCGSTLIGKRFVSKLDTAKVNPSTWRTKAGTFVTKCKVKAKFILPEFFENREIKWTMHVDESDSSSNAYDMIIGRDLLQELGIDLIFSQGKMVWDNASVPMRDPQHLQDTHVEALEDEIFNPLHFTAANSILPKHATQPLNVSC